MVNSFDPYPNSRPAREARALLSRALAALQAEPRSTAVDRTVELCASASSSLYEVETQARSLQASNAGIRTALEQLGEALSLVREGDSAHSEGMQHAAEAIARTLAVLYPLMQGMQRRRRDVQVREVPDEPPKSRLPRAPTPLGRPRLPSPTPRGRPLLPRQHRVFVEADIGLYSSSNFYTGLSQDLSTGGVFVATYQPQPPGTPISVYFELPDGHAIRAEGVVRWVRGETADSPPGMGVSFENLSQDDLAAVARFCSQRPPLYHDE